MTEEPAEKAVGLRIRQTRLRAGLTQAVLAERSGLAFETISRIERGSLNPTVRTLAAIAAALGVRAGSLIDAEDELPAPAGLDPSLEAVIGPLRDQPPRVRQTAARLVRALVSPHEE